jgi:hypothetical protein
VDESQYGYRPDSNPLRKFKSYYITEEFQRDKQKVGIVHTLMKLGKLSQSHSAEGADSVVGVDGERTKGYKNFLSFNDLLELIQEKKPKPR